MDYVSAMCCRQRSSTGLLADQPTAGAKWLGKITHFHKISPHCDHLPIVAWSNKHQGLFDSKPGSSWITSYPVPSYGKKKLKLPNRGLT